MTTIAYCGRYLAADTLGVIGGNRSEHPSCKLQVDGGIAYATGGMWWAIRQHLVDWHQRGHPIAEYPNPRGLDGCLVAVEADTRVCSVFTAEAPYPDADGAPIAFGTGGDLALGAMGAGVTAMEAVQIAMRWDLKTGGYVDFVDLEFIDKGVQRWDANAVRRVAGLTNTRLEVVACVKTGAMGGAAHMVHHPKCKGDCEPLNDGLIDCSLDRPEHGDMPCGVCWRCKQNVTTIDPDAIIARTLADPVSVKYVHDFTVIGSGQTARRVPDLSEDGITAVLAEMRRKHPGERVRAAMCVHGYIPSTCDTCRANRTANIYPV